MDRAAGAVNPKVGKGLPLSWFVGGAVCLLLVQLLGWFDDATELTPDHAGVLRACLAVAGLGGLLAIDLAIRKFREMTVVRRALLALLLGAMGFILVVGASTYCAEIIEGWIDFPPGKTTSYPALLSISRAYQTHGKGRSWNIQTTPIWSNLDITEDDYDFMLAHRRPGDEHGNPDEISSEGYFCAQVTMQRSGDALRVMHAGTHALPSGTVIVCPSGTR